MKTHKLDLESVKESVKNYRWELAPHQVAIYIACGRGFLGKLHAEQPAGAYIDLRVGKLPYPKSQIKNVRQVLIAIAKVNGLDPHNLPEMPNLHNCGVF